MAVEYAVREYAHHSRTGKPLMTRKLLRLQSVAATIPVAAALATGVFTAPAHAQFEIDLEEVYVFEFDFYPTCIAAGDLNGDGRIDFAMSGRGVDGFVAIMLGSPGVPPGTSWDPPSFIPVARQTNWIDLRDLDGDGLLDLVLTARGAPGRLVIARGFGDGSFGPLRRLPVGRDAANFELIDFDHDGDLDVAVAATLDQSVALFANAGDATMTPLPPVPLAAGLRVNARPYEMEQGNFVGDAARDLCVVHLAGGYASLIPGRMDAAPGDPDPMGPARRLNVGVPTTADIADVDRDGDQDILLCEWGVGVPRLGILENEAGEAFDRLNFGELGTYAWDVVAVDLDGDLDPDSIVTEVLFNSLFVLENTSDGGPAEYAVVDAITGGGFARHQVPIDLDFDCDLDLLIIDISSARVQVLRNETPQPPGSCRARDLNRDGLVGVQDLILLLNNWQSPGRTADLNHDGRTDFGDLLLILEAWS